MRRVRSQFLGPAFRLGLVVRAALVLGLLGSSLVASSASADSVLLGSFGSLGTGAGQLASFSVGNGVGVNRSGSGSGVSAGDVYVVDRQNNRVQQFSSSGVFVRAFGWNVVASGGGNVAAVSEVQSVVVPGGATGTFTLTYQGKTTAPLAATATAAQVQTSLLALSSVGTGNVTVTGGPAGTAAFTVTFAGALSNTPVEQITADSTNLVGGPAVTSTTTQGVSNFEICSGADVCQAATTPAGVAGVAPGAGGLNTSNGIAVDQNTGNLFITSQGNRRIDVFASNGTFQGAFGWGVKTGSAALEFCTTTCLTGIAGAGAGQFTSTPNPAIGYPAIDPATGHLYVPNPSNNRFDEFAPTISGGAVTGVGHVRSVGWGVATGAAQLETCTTTCQIGLAGNGSGQFNTVTSVAIDGAGSIYAVTKPVGCSTAAPCRVQRFDAAATGAIEFAPAETMRTTGSAVTVAVQNVAYEPSSGRVLVVQASGVANNIVVKEFDDDGTLLGTSPSGTTISSAANSNGLAIGLGGRWYVANSNARVDILGPPPAPSVTIAAPADVSASGVVLSGTVTPPMPGPQGGFATRYRFEYSTDGVNWTAFPDNDVNVGNGTGAGDPNNCPTGNPSSCNVSQTLTGLTPNTLYQARLVATTGTDAVSSTVVFTTGQVPPAVSATFVTDVVQTAAAINAHINPQSLATKYRFEYGSAPCSANPCSRVPSFDRAIGAGNAAIAVQEAVSGLEPNTSYFYRVVAINSAGRTDGPDRQIRTLGTCDLPNSRCPELVSPADKGSTGNVEMVFPAQQSFQASESGDGMAYLVLNGTGSGPSGGDVIYKSSRAPDSWSDPSQVTPPSLVPGVSSSGNIASYSGTPGLVLYFSRDLGCAVVRSINPLTADTPALGGEFGVENLYRWDADDGGYTLITNRLPLNPGAEADVTGNYRVVGASDDCSRVFFRARPYAFIAGASGLYEWDSAGGVLSDAGLRPDGAPGLFDVEVGSNVVKNAVSPDGQLVFTGISNEAPDSGKQAVFVRDGQTGEVVNASRPDTVVATQGAGYETASPDGKHVFFLANYGIASTTSSGSTNGDCSNLLESILSGVSTRPCDLYDYDVESGDLTDISAYNTTANPQGAVVQGVMAVSGDGETVYFAALGQLIAGKGRTYAQNLQGAGFANIYRYRSGASPADRLAYVGSLEVRDLESNSRPDALIHAPQYWTAQTNFDGSYFYFSSHDNMTGTNPQNVGSAYVFSEATGVTECVSCPQDGSPPLPREISTTGTAIASGTGLGANYTPRSLSDDGRVVFTAEDVLAPGAIEGDGTVVGSEAVKGPAQTNVYEWLDGQVSLLTTGRVQFLDMSRDGRDVFVRSYTRLDPRDIDAVGDVYDLRSGGGFDPPAVAPEPCDPGVDGCQGPGVAPDPSGSPGSVSRSGSGNAAPGSREKVARLRVIGRTARGSRVRLVLGVPGQGVLRMSGRGVVGSARFVKGAGTRRVAARLSPGALRTLRRKGRVRVGVTVRFVPSTGATPQIARTGLVLKLANRANNDRRGAK
jgi:hypothetical protein